MVYTFQRNSMPPLCCFPITLISSSENCITELELELSPEISCELSPQ